MLYFTFNTNFAPTNITSTDIQNYIAEPHLNINELMLLLCQRKQLVELARILAHLVEGRVGITDQLEWANKEYN